MNAKQGKLTRISSSDRSGYMKNNTIEGLYEEEPTEGEVFVVVGCSEKEKDCARLVKTSKVIQVTGNLFMTESGSVYRLDNSI